MTSCQRSWYPDRATLHGQQLKLAVAALQLPSEKVLTEEQSFPWHVLGPVCPEDMAMDHTDSWAAATTELNHWEHALGAHLMDHLTQAKRQLAVQASTHKESEVTLTSTDKGERRLRS
ncbi:hypothetical protein P7K49_026249 [Saguinus oedipus]|uniref:Uncharacterized protein n=1 Tax=Saguinus oedipus TaxID=9490 RepID=A0ABQ9UCM4_SAGOE|nr:hypothetical protein P7K49_026249 [Saguinus oedipus]